MKILCFGSCNIDYVYSIDHIVKPGETISSDDLAVFPGGKGLNQAVALAKAGAEVFFAGCVGADGAFLKQVLLESGVDIRYLRTVDTKTGHAIIQVDKTAENAIVIFSGANGCITDEYIEHVMCDFEAGDILLIQNEISSLDYLVEAAGKRGMQIFFNPSPLNDKLDLIDLRWVRCLIVNETEAHELIGTHDPENIQLFVKSKYPGMEILLTLGKRGSVYITSERIIKQNAYKIVAVDTTAAGDAYTGYYLESISEGYNIENAMDRASAASAITVSRKGASSSIPISSEVNSVISNSIHNTDVSFDRKELAETYFLEHYVDGEINQLASCLGYSVSYTSVWLKANFGCRFTDLLYKKKCQICADLLITSDISISSLIHRLGCSNESYFRKKFKKQYGCSMLEYRKRMRV